MEAGLIKSDDKVGASRKFARYLPFWSKVYLSVCRYMNICQYKCFNITVCCLFKRLPLKLIFSKAALHSCLKNFWRFIKKV